MDSHNPASASHCFIDKHDLSDINQRSSGNHHSVDGSGEVVFGKAEAVLTDPQSSEVD
ncbi:unnamed protein product [Ceratitis capitata]|uniref:(Mediterranean fruit fly) hypothetical protein n=1 Tax=Ceratitis capitata TaxID=7213 RepID=A0A811UG75_CERCA|nr:unnamed protein product [Ceratitis capitata]